VLAAAAIASAAIALTTGTTQPANWSCGAHPDADGHVKAVFGHTNTRAEAFAVARRVRVAFKFAAVEQAGCADWMVVVPGLDTPRQQREFSKEASDSGFPGVSFRTTTNLTLPSAPGTLKAVFGTFGTAAAASRMLQRAARAGFRLIGIGRYGLHTFKVIVGDIPLAKSQEFAHEVQSAGLSVVYELG
jgi:hypothetical protein